MPLGAPASIQLVRSSPSKAPKEHCSKLDLLPPQDKSAGQKCSASKARQAGEAFVRQASRSQWPV